MRRGETVRYNRLFVASFWDPLTRTWTACLTLNFLWACYLSASVITLFYEHVIGLTLGVIMLIPAWMNTVSAAAEVPSGYSADRMGIQKAMAYGLLAQIVQSLLLAFWARSFWPCIAVVTLNALSWSFTNGTTTALMDTVLPSEDDRLRYKRHQACAQHAGQLVGALFGGWLAAAKSLEAPVQLQPIPFVLGFVVLLMIPRDISGEATLRKRHKKTQGEAPKAKTEDEGISFVLRTMLVSRQDIRWLLALDASLYAIVIAASWLVQADLEEAGMPHALFPVIFIVQTGVGLVLALGAQRISKRLNAGQVQYAMTMATAFATSLAAIPFTGWLGAAAIYAAVAIHRAFSGTLASDAISRVKELEAYRTTAQSVHGALRAAVFVPMFFVGWFAQQTSPSAGFACLSLMTGFGCCYALLRYLRATKSTS